MVSVPNVVRKYAFGGNFQTLPHTQAATPEPTPTPENKENPNLNPKCVCTCIPKRDKQRDVHTHTHTRVHSLKKGVSENEAPGPVGAYTTTHNDTTTLMPNLIHKTEILTSRARFAEGVPAGCASLKHLSLIHI